MGPQWIYVDRGLHEYYRPSLQVLEQTNDNAGDRGWKLQNTLFVIVFSASVLAMRDTPSFRQAIRRVVQYDFTKYLKNPIGPSSSIC